MPGSGQTLICLSSHPLFSFSLLVLGIVSPCLATEQHPIATSHQPYWDLTEKCPAARWHTPVIPVLTIMHTKDTAWIKAMSSKRGNIFLLCSVPSSWNRKWTTPEIKGSDQIKLYKCHLSTGSTSVCKCMVVYLWVYMHLRIITGDVEKERDLWPHRAEPRSIISWRTKKPSIS